MQDQDNQGFVPPRARDPAWAHGSLVNGRHKIKCNYCHKIYVGGGITRLKQHLAGERGNVAPCEQVPEEIKVQMQQHLRQNVASQESINAADKAVARFMYEAGLPFSAANSSFFQQMADAIAAVGPGYKIPSYDSLRSNLLNREAEDAGSYCAELKKTWEVTGCSVLVDRWMDKTGRTVISFFVYCPEGTMFLKSVDASDITNSAEELLNLFDSVVLEVGHKNIVNFVTDSSTSYRTAGKLLMNRYKTFFCSTCGVQCIDMMLQEIGRIDQVNEVLAKAKKVTQFIYNNSQVLDLMRNRTGEKDILQVAITKFASIFLTLENILSLKDHLYWMFTGVDSGLSTQRAGLEVAEIILDPLFWSFCDQTVKVTKPLLSVLHLMESEEKPSVGYIYDAMEKAKKSIIEAIDDREFNLMPYLKVIDRIWQVEFHSPLHAAAYYLNPAVFYTPSFSSDKVIQKGVIDCIEALEPDLSAQVEITCQVNFYEKAVGQFGRPVAVHGRESLPPATWWSLYATDYPQLQRLALRILSQTCSITRCGRTSSMFERVLLKKRNRLEHQRLNDLIYVHYSLHLQNRQTEAGKAGCSKGTVDPLCLEATDSKIGDWMEDVGTLESEDLSLMEISGPSERAFFSQEVQNMDDSADSIEDRSGNVTKDATFTASTSAGQTRRTS